MGYYVKVIKSTAFIPAAKLQTAFEKMCALNTTHHDAKQGGSWSKGQQVARWFSWMDADYPSVCADAQAILEMLGFETEYRTNGDLELLAYDSKSGQEDLFLDAIKHELCGELHWMGEEGESWTQKFNPSPNQVVDAMRYKFLELFPNSYFSVTKASLSDSSMVHFTLLQRDDYPNKIINNDPMYHIICIDANDDGTISIHNTLSGLAVKPTNRMYAMETIKTGIRKKTGSAEQVTRHVDKWLDQLKETVVAQRDNIYGNFDRDKYIADESAEWVETKWLEPVI
jgi:hypothetical protein